MCHTHSIARQLPISCFMFMYHWIEDWGMRSGQQHVIVEYTLPNPWIEDWMPIWINIRTCVRVLCVFVRAHDCLRLRDVCVCVCCVHHNPYMQNNAHSLLFPLDVQHTHAAHQQITQKRLRALCEKCFSGYWMPTAFTVTHTHTHTVQTCKLAIFD